MPTKTGASVRDSALRRILPRAPASTSDPAPSRATSTFSVASAEVLVATRSVLVHKKPSSFFSPLAHRVTPPPATQAKARRPTTLPSTIETTWRVERRRGGVGGCGGWGGEAGTATVEDIGDPVGRRERRCSNHRPTAGTTRRQRHPVSSGTGSWGARCRATDPYEGA